ncbi:hypothetical protein LTR62_001554 [Meristemomyces frigidus]|uniref:Argonaute linker 1 domain-containing protein n=1 Tax=Meristemomyces frigidus TaxID=1508187 RepID=A0AAN7TG85_9PEZI|nr:hypothetical protein LTR62_001554 [Meristemomyces frigidus]
MAPITFCLRCPKDSPDSVGHKGKYGLLKCFAETSKTKYDFNTFWEGYAADMSEFDPNMQTKCAELSAAINSGIDGEPNYAMAVDVYDKLWLRAQDFHGVNVTRDLAKRVVELVNVKEQKKKDGKGGRGKAVVPGGMVDGERDGAVDSKKKKEKKNENDAKDGAEKVAAGSEGGGGTSAGAAADRFGASGTSKPLPPHVRARQEALARKTVVDAGSGSTIAVTNISSSGSDAAAEKLSTLALGDEEVCATATTGQVSSAIDLSAATPPAEKSRDPPKSAVAGSHGDVQSTNQDAAKKAIEDVATRMLGEDANHMDDTTRNAAITRISQKFGLRTQFANAGWSPAVYTNFLDMHWPEQIHVYSVEMLRESTTNGDLSILVKKTADKRAIIDEVSQNLSLYGNYLSNARAVNRKDMWVTDGDLIWSVVPLFHATEPATVPQPLCSANHTINYINEMGKSLPINKVTVSFVKTIDMTRPIGQMFFDDTADTYDESDPGLITRGFNAFFSRFARESSTNTSTSANKSYANHIVSSLDRSGNQYLFAMKGFFLSVRPGIESLYLNVNNATSPFMASISVSDFFKHALKDKTSGLQQRSVVS